MACRQFCLVMAVDFGLFFAVKINQIGHFFREFPLNVPELYLIFSWENGYSFNDQGAFSDGFARQTEVAFPNHQCAEFC